MPKPSFSMFSAGYEQAEVVIDTLAGRRDKAAAVGIDTVRTSWTEVDMLSDGWW